MGQALLAHYARKESMVLNEDTAATTHNERNTMKLTEGKLQAIMTCREYRAMGWQQIADHLIIPVHAAKQGYELACKKGMKARIPEKMMLRIDKKSKEMTPRQARLKYEREQKEKCHKKKARKSAWKGISKKERKQLIERQRKDAKKKRNQAERKKLISLNTKKKSPPPVFPESRSFHRKPMEMTAKSYARAARSFTK